MIEDQMTDNSISGDELAPTARMMAWARNSAAYRLSKRMMTERQLADAIARKARQKFDAITDAQVRALVDLAIAFGRDMKALDDVAYAEIRSLTAARSGKSRKAIAQSLVRKGVEREIVRAAVADTDDLRAALVFARRRAFGPFRREDPDEKRRARELAAFARQGFEYGIGARILAMDLDEALALLAGDTII